MVFYPAQGNGAVVMTNSDSGDRLVREVIQAIARADDWPQSEDL